MTTESIAFEELLVALRGILLTRAGSESLSWKEGCLASGIANPPLSGPAGQKNQISKGPRCTHSQAELAFSSASTADATQHEIQSMDLEIMGYEEQNTEWISWGHKWAFRFLTLRFARAEDVLLPLERRPSAATLAFF